MRDDAGPLTQLSRRPPNGDAMTLAEIKTALKQSMNEGELLAAIDLAQKGAKLATDPNDLAQMQIDEVILLARAASQVEAEDKFHGYDLGALNTRAAQSLRARLAKDLGFAATGATRDKHLAASRDLYQKVCDTLDPDWDRVDFEYNAINVVSLSAMIDDMAPAATLAAQLQAFRPLDSYYSWATRAELLLVTGAKTADVEAALTKALTFGADTSAQITTLTQLERLHPGHRALEVLRPRPFLHYTGHMIAAPGATQGRILATHENALSDRIAAALDRIAVTLPRGDVPAAALASIMQRRGTAAFQGRVFEARDALVLWEPEPYRHDCPLYRTIAVHPFQGDPMALAARLRQTETRLHAVAVAGDAHTRLRWTRALTTFGVSRVCAPGTLQTPPGHWHHDGHRWLSHLLHFVDVSS